MAKINITIEGYKCERCGHEWIPRTKLKEEPTICPKCKSPYWNKPKKKMKLPTEVEPSGIYPSRNKIKEV